MLFMASSNRPHSGSLSRRSSWIAWCGGFALAALGCFFTRAADPNSGTNRVVGGAVGFSYRNDKVTSVPWSVHVLRIERGNSDYELQTTMAGGTRFGLTPLSEQLRLLPPTAGRPLGAVNGDFYQNEAPYEGDPKGIQIVRGELVSAPSDWSCFWVDAAGDPHLGRVVSQFSVNWAGEWVPMGLNEDRKSRGAVLYTKAVGASTHTSSGVELELELATGPQDKLLHPGESCTFKVIRVLEQGDSAIPPTGYVLSLTPTLVARLKPPTIGAAVKVSFATTPSLRGVQTALGGGPALVREGKVSSNLGSPQLRHPRSAIGWDKRWIYLVQVDGRQLGLSLGMTYTELAEYMVKLGCEEALNLDGGGSATCWALGSVRNSPSEGHERGVANGLVVVQKSKPAPAATQATGAGSTR